MMTIRFLTGFSVQYNDAGFIVWGSPDGQHALYTKEPAKGGSLIARVPFDCIVEWRQPCRMYTAGSSPENAIRAALQTVQDRPSLNWQAANDLAALKRELTQFNARSKSWG